MAAVWALSGRCRLWHVLWVVALVSACAAGCRKRTGTTDPEAKLRLERLFELYQLYALQKSKGPPNEKALKDFIRNLPADQKASYAVGGDVDQLFTSPRDGQKYAVRYGVLTSPERMGSEALAWEQQGEKGKRFVALTLGYVEEYAEDEFNALKKAGSRK